MTGTRSMGWWTAALLAGCGHQAASLEDAVSAGMPVSAVVIEGDGDTLHAEQLRVARGFEHDDDEQDEDVPIESLPPAVRAAVDARYPGATLLAAEHEEGEWGVELVTADGDHLEAEFDGDGDFLESEPADEGDDDGELARRAFVQGVPESDGSAYRLLGVAVDPVATAVPSGPVRFTGSYATSLTPSRVDAADAVSAIGGVSQGVEQTPDGLLVTLLGRTVVVDDATEVLEVEDPLEGADDDD